MCTSLLYLLDHHLLLFSVKKETAFVIASSLSPSNRIEYTTLACGGLWPIAVFYLQLGFGSKVNKSVGQTWFAYLVCYTCLLDESFG